MTPQFDYITRRRFNFIELIIHWEGRLTTNHLQKHFAIFQLNTSQFIDANMLSRSMLITSMVYLTKLKNIPPIVTESI